MTLIAIIGLGVSIYGYAASILSTLGTAESPLFNNVSIGLACTGFVLFMLYNFWYSSLGREKTPVLRVGKLLPKFELTNIRGEQVNSESFAGTPTIYIFYQGNWCPLCMAQIKEISAKERA
ncbi:MAG: redoxin domain-containing protein [Methylomarinum sp.]|nr:redoxin domain-containing protein [Methylomarinum sp.]